MGRFRTAAALLAAFILLFSAAFAEEVLTGEDIPLEDLVDVLGDPVPEIQPSHG